MILYEAGAGTRPYRVDPVPPAKPTPMTVIALVLVANLLLAGLFSLVAVALD